MASTTSEGFRIFLGRLKPSDPERDKASLRRQSIYSKLDTRFGLYRMFESGSFRHGTGVSGKSDVDFFVFLKTGRPALASSTLTAVKSALQERFPSTYIHVSRPAVVLEFGGGYERVEIIPAYYSGSVNDSTKFKIAGVVEEWMDSTPEKHLEYVNDSNKLPKAGAAKSLARLAKAWKYYRDVPISSFYLEMKAASYIRDQTSVDWPIDLYYFLRRLQLNQLSAMNDPTGSTGCIRACSSDAKKADALSKLDTAVSRAKRAMDHYIAGREREAFDAWDLLFSGQFPGYY